MSSFSVKILMDRTVAYYNHVPMIWQLFAAEPFREAQTFEQYFKVWGDMVASKVPFTHRGYARRCIEICQDSTYRWWFPQKGGMSTGGSTERPSPRMLSELEEAYHVDRKFFRRPSARSDLSETEWSRSYKDQIDRFLNTEARNGDNELNEPNFDAVQTHLKNPKCLLRVLARYMKLIKGRSVIEQVWNSTKQKDLVKYRPSSRDSYMVNILVTDGLDNRLFAGIPRFAEQMRNFFDNPMRDITPFVYGWYTQDSLRKALFLHKLRDAQYVGALRFRKGFRWATQDMVGFFQGMQQTLHKAIMNMGKEAGPPRITEIVKKGLALESAEGGVGGRSGS